ncbi:serine/threonine protein kinase [Streptomyces sp. NPDC058548]|uniref:serine/threonine protein kinase n=1 Tax=Streptomyces sp. NPDC058548 TaxID=3346545 RepID=UPI00364CB439
MIAELGRGGMGRVFLGSGPDGRLVALKQVHSWLAENEQFRTRFRREVNASRSVSGAYTAAVIDADTEAASPWLASVFVPGPSLHEAVEAVGVLPDEAVLRLAAGLATALVEVHRAGLVHRDLKPSNVLLAEDGPRLLDFGIARATDNESAGEVTRPGGVVGSPGFMSPEQAAGLPVGTASDVFSLGALLVMACTGTSPFADSTTRQILYNVVHTEADLGTLPTGLRRIIEPCLAKEPTARPALPHLLDMIGRIPPAARPWPPAVHQLITRQGGQVARLLAEAQQRMARRETITATQVEPEAPSLPSVESAPPPTPLRRRWKIAAGVTAAFALAMATPLLVSEFTDSEDADAPTPPPTTTTSSQPSTAPVTPTTEPSVPAPAVGLNAGAWYDVMNTNSGMCVDANQWGTTDGTTVIQWPCLLDRANQQWQFTPTGDGYYRVVNRNAPTLGWDVTGGSGATANGASIQLWSITGGGNQHWKPVPLGDGKYSFIAQHSGMCLDVTNHSTSAGTQVQQWACVGNHAQTFTLTQRP